MPLFVWYFAQKLIDVFLLLVAEALSYNLPYVLSSELHIRRIPQFRDPLGFLYVDDGEGEHVHQSLDCRGMNLP